MTFLEITKNQLICLEDLLLTYFHVCPLLQQVASSLRRDHVSPHTAVQRNAASQPSEPYDLMTEPVRRDKVRLVFRLTFTN